MLETQKTAIDAECTYLPSASLTTALESRLTRLQGEIEHDLDQYSRQLNSNIQHLTNNCTSYQVCAASTAFITAEIKAKTQEKQKIESYF